MTQIATNEAPAETDGRETTHARTIIRPATDIYETESEVVVAADLPGVAPDGVDVRLEQGVLTIRAAVTDGKDEKHRQLHAEYADGYYERVFNLSEKIDQGGIEARQKDGVLVLVLPKAKEAQARSIKVKSG